jgi:hypothetical protein
VAKAQEVEGGAEGDKVVDAGMAGGVLGRRALDIRTRTLGLASKNLRQAGFYPSRSKGADHGEILDQ